MKIKLFFTCFISIFLILGCHKDFSTLSDSEEKRFAIYLSNSTYYTPPFPDIDSLEMDMTPLLTAGEITSYKWSEHLISFPETVHNNLQTHGNLLHKLFIIVVEGERIYYGHFTDALDSQIFQNPTIWLLWRHPDGRNTTPESFQIERGYSKNWEREEDSDLRENPKIYQALQKAGILQ